MYDQIKHLSRLIIETCETQSSKIRAKLYLPISVSSTWCTRSTGVMFKPPPEVFSYVDPDIELHR